MVSKQVVFIRCACMAVVALTSLQRPVLVHGLVPSGILAQNLRVIPVRHRLPAWHVHMKNNGNPEDRNGANTNSNYSKKIIPSAPRKELLFGPLGSLEVLAFVVSLFFTATVLFAGDLLFATPSKYASKVPILNAEEVLQKDFIRNDSSVPF
jgi:hypothetical protein